MSLNPGRGLTASTLTTADGRIVRHVQAGSDGPVVVFEAGMGACASEWVTVQRLVSASTRTVSYDRAGHGGSTEDRRTRSLSRICEDLGAVIGQVSRDEPVVLVAHSWGGPIVRCFAELHPDRVAGVVLVDTTTAANIPAAIARITPYTSRLSLALNRIGLTRSLLTRVLFKHASPEMSEEDRAILARDITSAQSLKTGVAEAKALHNNLPLMRRWEQEGLPDVPVISLVGGGTGRRLKARSLQIAVAQQEMSRHPQGECRVVAGTSHFVPQDKPLETVQAVLEVVDRVRKHIAPSALRAAAPTDAADGAPGHERLRPLDTRTVRGRRNTLSIASGRPPEASCGCCSR